jgi:NAD(P)H-hydrate repair Nnr-like enzyme with NAD(P)H-hydrate dehydratase domain
MQDYWLKQSADKPLYPDLLWSRPENKQQAGKLLIIGGNSEGFAAPGEAYVTASKAGVGKARVLLPDKLQKMLGRGFEAGEFAPSTKSGSFARVALADWLDHSLWADGVLLAGDLARNSETAILLESYLDKYEGQVTITRDVITYFNELPTVVLQRPNTLLVLSMSQLQKLGIASRFTMAFTLSMDLLRLIENLHEFTKRYPIYIITKHLDTIISTTKLAADIPVWRLRVATHASVWCLQNPGKPLEALTTAVHQSLLD